MVGADVGDHRDVVPGHPDPASQDPAPGGLGHRELDPGLTQHLPGPARPGVVAGLDQLTVEVDPVGARPADAQPGPLGDVADHPRCGRLPVGPGDGDHGDGRTDQPWRWTGRDGGQRLALGRDQRGQRLGPLVERVERPGQRPTERFGPAFVAPGVRDDQFVDRRAGPGPDTYPGHAARRRQPADQFADEADREPLPEQRVGRAGPRTPQPDRRGHRGRLLLGQTEQHGEVEGDLGRRTREVQVRPVEQPEFDQ